MKQALTALLVALIMTVACRNLYTQVPIVQSATLSKDWTELHPSEPLVWTQPTEEFTFHLDSEHERTLDLELIGPNGERSVPDVQLVDDDGRTFALDVHGFLNEDMFFTRQTPVPKIRAIRIRNSFPIRISNVRWVGYDPEKVKR